MSAKFPSLLAACLILTVLVGTASAGIGAQTTEKVGAIELWVDPAESQLWAIVQWQDGLGQWHDVEGWQDYLRGDHHQIWEVFDAQLGQKNFRWEVYRGQRGTLLVQTGAFDLPASDGETVRVEVRLPDAQNAAGTVSISHLYKEFKIMTSTRDVLTGPRRLNEAGMALWPLHDDYMFHPLPGDHLVTTSEYGEALLQAEKVSGRTCKVYLFQDSTLVKRACPRADSSSGNSSCLEEGAAAFSQCSDYLLMTPSGQALVTGTWVWVAYLPAYQLTLYAVLDGRATVWPVLNFVTGQLGQPIGVGDERFIYTMPDAMLASYSSLPVPSREPRGLAEITLLAQQFNLQRWMDRVGVRAAEDGVLSPDFPAGPHPAPIISFWSDDGSVHDGDSCTTLRWDVSNARTVNLDGKVVAASGSQQVCLSATTIFTLEAVGLDGASYSQVLVIQWVLA